MADDAQKPAADGEEKSPVFQTGMGAFDRAGFDKSVTKGEAASIKDEDIEKRKTADKVYEEARKYYNKNYEDAIKKIDPAFDKNSPEVSLVAETTFGSNLRRIKKDIDEGKPLDGAKDVLPLAENAAKNRVSLANKLKTGTVTTIAEYVGLSDIKDMDGYGKVAEEFDKTTKDDKNKFEDLLSKFWNGSLRAFNTDTPGAESAMQKLYTPENNAIIAALAKILETEGFSSESVKNMSKRFDENLKEFASKISQKVEGVSTTTGATGTTGGTGATGATEPQKIEQKIEEKGATGATGATGAVTATEPQKVEEKKEAKETAGVTGAMAASTGAAVTTEPQKVEEKLEKTSTGLNIPKPATTEKKEEKLEGKEAGKSTTGVEPAKEKREATEAEKSAASLFASIFGGEVGGKKETAKEGETTSGKKVESTTASTKLETAKGTIEKTQTGSTTIGAAGKETMAAKAPTLSTAKSTLQEKVTKSSETISAGTGIKETTPQKLASVSTPAPTAESKSTETETAPGAGAETNIQMGKEGEKGSEEGGTEKTTASKEEKGGSMESKLEMMIGLLSQMNETLQGPLLTINHSKKYE